MKQETIEEVAERIYPMVGNEYLWHVPIQRREGFIEGAKWQEQQQDKFAIDFAEYVLDWNRDTTSDYLQIILEQFKNK